MASVNFAELPDEVVPKFSELMSAARRAEPLSHRQHATGRDAGGHGGRSETPARSSATCRPQSFVRNPLYGHRDCRRVTRISAPAGSTLWQAASETRRNASGGW